MSFFDGTPGKDVRSGGGGEDYLYGNYGSDTFNGNGGNDILRGGSDGDLLYGGTGADMVDGDAGNDRLYGGDNVDILLGDAGNDSLYGGTGSDDLDGGIGADRLSGGSGADHFSYGSINDSRPGSFDVILDFSTSGGDVLDFSSIDARSSSGGGQDFTFIGQSRFSGEGQVRYYHSGGDTFVEANTKGSGAAELVVKLEGSHNLTSNDFILHGGVNNDSASNGFSHLTTGSDVKSGGGGDDYIYGDAGNDQLYGGGDRDALRGGEGADLLDGGAGSDFLDGSPDRSRDTFRFTGHFGDDIVKDFDRGEDVLAFNVPGVDSRSDLSFSGNVIHAGSYGSVTLGSGISAASLGSHDIIFI